MSADDIKILGRSYIEGFWNGTGPIADQLIAEDYAVHDPGTPGRAGGVQGEKQCLTCTILSFPIFISMWRMCLARGTRQ
jgi:hypothetical protein